MDEFIAFVEIFVLHDYDVPDLDWQAVEWVIDAGANIGVATIWFAERAKQATIVAVEPSPLALELLELNIDSNQLTNRVRVEPSALGATGGVGYLQSSGSSVETQVASRPAGTTLIDEPVTVTTLEGLMGKLQLSSIDLLKLDCEGAEYEVLLSANAKVLRRFATIVGEHHRVDGYEPKDLRAHLEKCGFNVLMRPHPRDPTLGMFIAQRDGNDSG